MQMNFRNLCLVGSIALIGADRIDFFAGRGPFIFTPFLCLSSLFLLTALLSRLMQGNMQLRLPVSAQRQTPFLVLAYLFLAFTFLSIPFGLDPSRGLMHFADLLLVVVFAHALSVGLLMNPKNERLIVRAVSLGIFVYLLFCVGECVAWSKGFHFEDAESYSYLQTMFAPALTGIFPRLCGSTVDPNRSGFVLTMYLMLLDRFAPQTKHRRILGYVIAFFVILTLSKSALLSYLIYQLSSRAFWTRIFAFRTVVWIFVAGVALTSSFVLYRTQLGNVAAVWESSNAVLDRLSFGEGTSGESHILLIQRGFDVWKSTPKTVLMGIGFGAAPQVVGDILGTAQKQANFHSLYVSVLAELGLPAFVTIMIILVYPFLSRVQTASAILYILVFNVAYQSHLEPIFWLALSVLWSNPLRRMSCLSACWSTTMFRVSLGNNKRATGFPSTERGTNFGLPS